MLTLALSIGALVLLVFLVFLVACHKINFQVSTQKEWRHFAFFIRRNAKTFQLPSDVKRFSLRIHSDRRISQFFAFASVSLIVLTTLLAMVSTKTKRSAVIT